jgi:membrane-associated phospholipid phosphatase
MIGVDRLQTHWSRQIAAALASHVSPKAMGTTLFLSVFFYAYFYVLNNPSYPVFVMPVVFLDRQITFQPLALPLYLSLWLYVSLAPALLETRSELYRYSRDIGATCLAGLAIFFFWPTAVPAANIDWTQHPGMDFLKNIDSSGNACPSLHVASAAFSGIWLHFLLSGFRAPWWIISLNCIWGVGIIYSTLATGQHVLLDVLAGLALGGSTAWWSSRHRRSGTTASGRGTGLPTHPEIRST